MRRSRPHRTRSQPPLNRASHEQASKPEPGALIATAPVDPRLLRHARSARGFFVAQAVVSLAHTGAIVVFAWFITQAITAAVDHRGIDPIVIGVLFAAISARALAVWATERIAARAAARVGSQLRLALITAIDRRGSAWLQTQSTPAIVLTATRGLGALDAYFGRFLPQLVATVVTTPILIATIFMADLASAITIIVTLPLIPIFMILIGLATRAVQQQQWSALQRLSVRFSDTVHGLATLRIFGRAERAANTIESSSNQYRVATMKVLRVTFLSGFALELLASLAVAIIAVSVGLRLLAGDLTLDVGLFVLLLAPDAFLPLRQVGAQFHAATEGVEATRDVLDLLDNQSSAAHPHLTPHSGEITARNLVVSRGDHRTAPVTVIASPGTITTISGPSGCGKSSFFAALRGAAPYDGVLEVGGVDARLLDPATWLAWAGQAPVLFRGSVADNISLGSTHDPTLIAWALATAGAHEIAADTVLGENGAGLSGGQAQRVAVARALYRWRIGAARVIALDEPSSALDADTEQRLWQGLRSIADDGATVLVISHRASAIAMADTAVSVGEATQ